MSTDTGRSLTLLSKVGRIMDLIRGVLIGLLLAVVLPLDIAFAQSDSPVESIDQYLGQSPQNNSFWSITVRDSSGNYLVRRNSEKLIRPASNLKLVTSGMLLDQLGEDYCYETPMYGVGTMRDSVWNGDILFLGRGDPSISERFYDRDKWHVFEKFYQALDSLGIKRITGSIIGNDSYFASQPYPEGWDWNDLSFYYAAEINALSFNGNTVDLDVHANGEVGDTPSISWFPFNTNYVRFINEQVIAPAYTEYDESYRRALGTNTIILRSKLPKSYFEEEPLAITEPSRYFVDTFLKYIERKGIEVGGSTIVEHDPTNIDSSTHRLIKVHRSHRLDTLIYQINRESSNFYTEMMMRTAAAEHFDSRGSTELGLKLISKFANKMAVDTSRLILSDGSGMAGNTLTTTQDLSDYLLRMRNHPLFQNFYESLSVSGESGTFDYRFSNSPVAGKLRGKSGYISGVRTISGYLETSSGRQLIISLAANHYTIKTKKMDQIQEKILEYLYRKY